LWIQVALADSVKIMLVYNHWQSRTSINRFTENFRLATKLKMNALKALSLSTKIKRYTNFT